MIEWTQEKIDLLKKTLGPKLTNDELELFLHICRRTGLDPFVRQIFPVPRQTKTADGKWETKHTFQTSIDGYRLIAERTGKYSPGRSPTYMYDKDGKIFSAKAYIKKQTMDGTWHEVEADAFWNEYVQTTKEGKPTKFWEEKPNLMLAKCAEALALRKAFPAELSGIYTEEELPKTDFITEEQREEIINKLSVNPTLFTRFCKKYPKMDEIPSKDYETIVSFINRATETPVKEVEHAGN